MAKVCEICQKKALVGNIRSHSNIASKRKMKVNLQTKRIGRKKIVACTSCLKTIKKLQKTKTV
ncbi:50S ribosomal protein L28 [Candidatus Parcubacteria bacterium]|nr:MAG: 50S ribosomal protein L28 [Candidatus Parcubacteria bacterium]